VECDEDGWPEMTMARRQLWFGHCIKKTSDEALVRVMLDPRIKSRDRHDEAPWAFKVDGDVYEEYEYIDALARNRGYGSSTRIERVDNGAR
jgi:ribosomal protein L3